MNPTKIMPAVTPKNSEVVLSSSIMPPLKKAESKLHEYLSSSDMRIMPKVEEKVEKVAEYINFFA